jgi:hypothetical protein
MLKISSGSSVAYTLGYRHGGAGNWQNEVMTADNSWSLYSDGHNISKLGSGNIGGVFRLVKSYFIAMPTQLILPGYEGFVFPRVASGYSKPSIPPQLTDAKLNAAGTTMIARTTPNSSTANLSTALGEVSLEGIPAMSGMATWRNRAHVARSAGDEYLNVAFGWLPLVSDLRDFAYAVKHHHKILMNYRKGSDKKIRRRYVLTENTSTTGRQFNFGCNTWATGGTGNILTQTDDRVWFSGAFRYHVPMGPGVSDKFAYYHSMADKLLGVDLTPEVVWNLAPWSWASDWFGNVGDVMHNISALGSDGLVLEYGYAMSSKKRSIEFSSDRGSLIQNDVNLLRLPSTPYGFGFNMANLSARQTAVLVALGLSRT